MFADERAVRPDDGAGAVAWQKQLRDRYLTEGTPAVPHLDLKQAAVRPISRRTASEVILKYEWLGTMSASQWHFGVFFGNHCAGATCVVAGAGTASPKAAVRFGLAESDLAVLARGACVHWAPTGTNSKLVAWTCRLLARHTGLKLIQAFSDPEAGEIGTIYQACNWIYLGETKRSYRLTAPDGTTYDYRRLDCWAKRDGVNRSNLLMRLRSEGWTLYPAPRKGRYVYVLDRADKALTGRIEAMRKPYPKRACVASIVADAPSVQDGEGGSTPTATLQGAV